MGYYIKECVVYEYGKSGVSVINKKGYGSKGIDEKFLIELCSLEESDENVVKKEYEDGDLVKFIVENDEYECRYVVVIFKC